MSAPWWSCRAADESDLDEKDETKRKSRNLSEKKRRDQFNMLINELCSMVSTSSRKMDKSTVLRATIAFLRAHNDVSIQNQEQESQENWKPSFLSNEEFTHLMLESLEGFLLVLSLSGQILYTSESVASLLGYLPHELHNIFILDILHESDHGTMCEVLSSASSQGAGIIRQDGTHGFPLGGLEYDSNSCSSACSPNTGSAELAAPCLVAMVRLQTPQLMHELILCDGSRNEFSSRHSLEWKFLFLDHRAPPIIGYLPFEVLGTSGYDYYHVEDLEKVAAGQEALMQTGEGTSCHYRFLTKGQQWIWLQTRYYITYHQWSSKPEFVVCTHTVMSYDEDLTHSKAAPSSGVPAASYSRTSAPTRMSYQSSRVSSAPSVSSRDSLSPNLSEKSGCAGGVLREEHGSSARSCGNQLSLPFTEACTITRESPTMGRLAVARLGADLFGIVAAAARAHGPEAAVPDHHGVPRTAHHAHHFAANRGHFHWFRSGRHGGGCSGAGDAELGCSQRRSVVRETARATSAVAIAPHLSMRGASDPHLSNGRDRCCNRGTSSACLENNQQISPRSMQSQPPGQVSPLPPQQQQQQQQQQQHAGGQQPQQDQFQDYLRRRHQTLQQQIIRQQEELRRVSEQLMLVHFINPNLAATVTSGNAPLYTLSLPTTTLSVPTSTMAGPATALTPTPYLLATGPAGCMGNALQPRDPMQQTKTQQLQQQQSLQQRQQHQQEQQHRQQQQEQQHRQQQQDSQSLGFLETVPPASVAPCMHM
nr:circadian locomoter output cycles protein kaput-like [Rhipicephalus microplus]